MYAAYYRTHFRSDHRGGAGVSLVELTLRFLKQRPGTRIYLNPRTAEAYPAWADATVIVPSWRMNSPSRKAAAVFKLQLGGFPRFPDDGVCWFPFGPMMPLSFRGCGVSTIHDTLDLDLPSLVAPVERAYRKVIMPATVRHTSIVTDSNFSRDRLRHHYGAEAAVIPLAVQTMPPPSNARVPAVPYVFYPANGYAHKNHRFLIELWRTRPVLRPLALVFTLASGSAALAPALASARAAGANITVTGRVSREELSGLYRHAVCTALPTLYEGFGLPLQEALMCDCPALANEGCPAFFEIVTEGYPYFLPLQADRWIGAILALAEDPPTKLQHFVKPRTWDETAREYLDFFDATKRG